MRLYSAVSFFLRRGGRGGAGRASQKAKRKVQNAKVKPQKRLSWIMAVLAGALPFAFCALPFDLFFPRQRGASQKAKRKVQKAKVKPQE
jgi:elongation factor P hydroxylase